MFKLLTRAAAHIARLGMQLDRNLRLDFCVDSTNPAEKIFDAP